MSRLAKIVHKLESAPRFLQKPLLNLALGRTVKLVGTAGVKCLELTPTRSVFHLNNKTKVQNHIKGIHAAAMALLAETASGMVVGMNIPEDKIPVIKSLHVAFTKRCIGDLTATATLTKEQIDTIKTQDKGEVDVKVVCIDSESKEPIQATMIWAWVSKTKIDK